MSPRRRRAVEFEQLWYGWSQENLDGSRGYGVVAASPGWKPLLDSSNDVLGPAVAFPDVPGDRTPPASGPKRASSTQSCAPDELSSLTGSHRSGWS